VEQGIETRGQTRFMLPVHLFGHAVDGARLESLRDRFELRVIEDCAQAIGARSRGVPVGSVGAMAATSFYPTKNLGALGDGGAVLTRSEPLAALARALRDYGQTEKYEHRYLGLNSRLDELHAAVLRDALLPRLQTDTKRRCEIAEHYREGIRHEALRIPPAPEGSESVWHLFPLLVEGGRGAFQEHLRAHGVGSGVHYPILIPDQEAMKGGAAFRVLTPLPRAREFAERELSLPIHPHLEDAAVERVIEACNSWRP
jgi:dTDP-3-amino-3,4,6-trideoxy-alpha-D-glucose transaminase